MAANKGRAGDPMRAADSLSFLLNKLAQLVGRRMAEALAPMQIQPRDAGILATIAQLGPQSQLRLGELLVIDRTTMVLCVDRLEELSLVQRTVHPEDRRVFLIELTTEGRAAVPAALRRLQAFEARLLSPLSPQGQRRFREYLYRVVEDSLPPEVRIPAARRPAP
jgi:MarR family transcriptional regulator, lower aerobic nicotinate degradation pathway regulator